MNKKEIKRREKEENNKKKRSKNYIKKKKPVAPVHNFDHKILPEGSGTLRWAGWGRPKFDRFYTILGVE
jgi:hypothetical protein